MEETAQKTIAIIIFGESQTCKSSIIKLFQQYGSQVENSNVQIGELHKGKSCTQKPEIYIFVSQTGYKFIFIDTKGFNDNIDLETDVSISIKLQEFLSNFTDVFIQHNVEQVNFIVTECLENATSQLYRNLPKLHNLLGKNGYLSTMILFTKYNPQLLNLGDYYKNLVNQRVKSVEQDIRDFEQSQKYDFNMKTMKFHTQIPDNSLPKLKDEFFVRQEQEFINIIDTLNSYPIQIFQEYAEYCQKRIEELHQTCGIGIIEYEQQSVYYTDEEQTVCFRGGPRRYLGFIDKVWQNVTVKKPNIEVTKKTIEIRTKDDIKVLFNTDSKYLEEKQEKLNSLFEQYTN